MSVCRHCKGTGQEPDTVTLECIGCQKPVRVKFETTADLVTKCENVRCRDCEKLEAAPTTLKGRNDG